MKRIDLYAQRLSAYALFKIEWSKEMIKLAMTGKYTQEEAEQKLKRQFIKYN